MPAPLGLSGETALERTPSGPWLRTWLTGIGVAVLLLGGLEVFWRDRGHRPSIVDSEALWSFHRDRVADADENTVILVGLSRMLLGFDGATFHAQQPQRTLINLAINGRSPGATLRDLALTETFSGVIICQISSQGFERSFRDRQQDYVDHYHKHSGWNERLDTRLGSLVQGNLCVANPQLRFSEFVPLLMRGKDLPPPLYLVTHDDRLKSADYSLMNIERHRAWRIARREKGYREAVTPTPELWAIEAAEFRPWVEKIQSNGGTVVFVRFPTSSEHWELDEQYYPRKLYWNRLADLTGALTIHFRDEPGMDGFECPDTSHLDQRDAPPFTRALLTALTRHAVLGKPQAQPTPR